MKRRRVNCVFSTKGFETSKPVLTLVKKTKADQAREALQNLFLKGLKPQQE